MRLIQSKFKKTLTLLFTFFVLPLISFAQITVPGPSSGSSGIQNPLKFNTFTEFLTTLLNIIITIAVPIVVLAIVYSGFLFVTAQGNETKLEKAKKVIVWTLIGGVLVLGAQVVATAIQGTVDELRVDNSAIILALEDV
ncbi:hypothetical protein IID26_02905 [Patescibacteria group bacterium]|nr:hypothetical protein [Patescibacteria group bacterium]